MVTEIMFPKNKCRLQIPNRSDFKSSFTATYHETLCPYCCIHVGSSMPIALSFFDAQRSDGQDSIPKAFQPSLEIYSMWRSQAQ